MSSRQEAEVENKVSVAAFTSGDEKLVGEGREKDTTEEGFREKKGVIYLGVRHSF